MFIDLFTALKRSIHLVSGNHDKQSSRPTEKKSLIQRCCGVYDINIYPNGIK